MALPEINVQALDGGLGIQPDDAAGTHAKVGVSSVLSEVPVVLSGPGEVRTKLGYGPLANACIDSFANGAKTIICMPSAGVLGSIGAQTLDNEGSGTIDAAGAPADAFVVIIEIVGAGGLNEATFRYSLDEGQSWSDTLTVPATGLYTIPDSGIELTFTEGPAGASPASVSSGVPLPVALADGAQLVWSINGGADHMIGIQAAPAVSTDGGAGPFALADGMTIQVQVNESVVDDIVTLVGAEFDNIAMVPLAELIAYINPLATGWKAVDNGGFLQLQSLRAGSTARLEITGGSAVGALGLQVENNAGVGNVGDVSAVTLADLEPLIEANPDTVVTQEIDGRMTLSTFGTGLAATIQVKPGTAAALGFDNLLHTGSDGGESFVQGDTLSFETTAPAMSVGTAASALDTLLASAYQYEFIHLVGAAGPAMWTVADTKAAAAEDTKRWVHILCEARLPADGETTDQWVAAMLADALTFQSVRVAVAVAPLALVDALTGAAVIRNGAGIYAGRLSAIPVQRSPGRVGDGALTSVLSLAPAGLTDGQIEQLDAAGFVTFRTFQNTQSAKGVYVTLGRMMAGNTSDYKLVQNRRVMDKALWLVREKGLPFLQDEADAGPDDSPGGLARFEASLQTALDAMESAGEIAAGRVIVPEDQNILSTQTVRADVKIQPRGYMNFIEATVGFENPALAA